MFSSLESTFLKHLDAICNKYKEIDEDGDEGIDLTMIDGPYNPKLFRKRVPVQTTQPLFFSFLRKRRRNNVVIQRFRFEDAEEEFSRIYKILHDEPSFEDLYIAEHSNPRR